MEEHTTRKIDLNTANLEELESLRGIGRRLAQRIIDSRREFGPFKKASDLVERVDGVGQNLFEDIADFVYVEAESAEASQPEPYAFSISYKEEAEGEEIPIVFSGEARLLQGIIPYRNVGKQRISSITFPLEGSELRTAKGLPLTGIPVRQRLLPGEEINARVSLTLDSRTPPGVYESNLVLGEERYPVVFRVAETVEIDVAPRRLILNDSPDSKVEKTVYVTNNGNVAVQIGDIGVVGIDESNLKGRVIRRAVGQIEGGGVDATVDAIAHELDRSFTESGALVVRTRNKPVDVLPGESASVELEISIPPTIKEGRRYWTRFVLYNTDILVLLQPLPLPKDGSQYDRQ